MQEIVGMIRMEDDGTRLPWETGTEGGAHGFRKYGSGDTEILMSCGKGERGVFRLGQTFKTYCQ